MSAWMSGIGLGLQAAQMEQSRNQQAQEMAFRQQQAGINNAQEDRRFEAAQAADVRDFDAMQQWRAFQQQQPPAAISIWRTSARRPPCLRSLASTRRRSSPATPSCRCT